MTPLSGLITQGLGLPAANNMILNFFGGFSLEIGVTTPEQPPVFYSGGGGGGWDGRPAWNVFNPSQLQGLYKPYTQQYQQQYLAPVYRKTYAVYIKLNVGGNTVERMYEVTERGADLVVRVINVVNTSRSRISVAIDKLRKAMPFVGKVKGTQPVTVSIKRIRRSDSE